MNEKKYEKLMAQEREERCSYSQHILEFMKIPAYLFDESPLFCKVSEIGGYRTHSMMGPYKRGIVSPGLYAICAGL